jgi:uncharacterized membrane protein
MSQNDRPNLEGVPESMKPGASDAPNARPEPPRSDPPRPGAPQSASGGFDLNYPTIISLCYISSLVLGVTSIVGVVLAYVWRSEPQAEWEVSHYQYLINTFWIGLVGFVVGFVLVFFVIGLLILPAIAVLVVVRSVMSLIKAQNREPMPNPATLLV